MAFVGRRMLRLSFPCLPALILAPVLSAQAPLETIPDPVRLAPAEVPFVNPLWQALDAPAAAEAVKVDPFVAEMEAAENQS